jgi:hypothetical protein
MSSSRKAPARAAAVIGLAGAAILAGCAVPAPPASPSASASAPSGAASSPPAAASSAPAATTAPASAPSSGAAAVPVLGQLTGVFAHGQGFGQVRPAEVFNGGDPTGLVSGITWSSWGGTQAAGTGTGYFDPPSEPVAASKKEPATIVAFRLGTCDGRLMYEAVEWYFPESGQSFSSSHYENVCTGTFVPAS